MESSFTPKCLICQSPVKPIQLSDFGPVFGPPLGSGAYGTVRKHKSDRFGAVAIKTVAPLPDKPIVELDSSVIREISTLVALFPHPDIIGLYGFDIAPNGVASIVLECGLMSLSDAIKKGVVGGDNDVSRSIMGQLFRATQYMHQQDIWHRDIKPANVIVTQLSPTIKVKLADFGLSRSGPFCGVTPTQVMYTLWYRPPEILINEVLGGGKKAVNVYDDSAEMWALGIVYWELLAATIADKNITKVLRSTADPTPMKQLLTIFRMFGFSKEQEPLRTELAKRYWPFGSITTPNTEVIKSVMSEQTWKVLAGMLNTEPTQRITLSELMSTPPSSLDDLYKKEVMVLSRQCIAGLPGKNYQEQLLTFTRTSYRMLKFIVDNKMIKDLATFFIAMQSLGCLIGSPVTTIPIETQGLLCAHLAGKYYSRRKTDMEDVLLALNGLNIIASDLTRNEIAVFNQLHGDMHRPNCFRFMVEMFEDCQSEHTKPLFAWSYGVMCATVMSKAVFVGRPSDVAKLAINIAAHQLRIDVATTLPKAVLTVKELVQGAKLVHGTFVTLHTKERDDILKLILSVVQDMLGSITITPNQFMDILQGKRIDTKLGKLEGETESDEGDVKDVAKQQLRKREREPAEDFELSV